MVMRAKLQVAQVIRHQSSEQLRFIAVGKTPYPEDGSDGDNTYAKFSPQAELNITVANPELFGKFNPGDKFYVDFTSADKPEPTESEN